MVDKSADLSQSASWDRARRLQYRQREWTGRQRLQGNPTIDRLTPGAEETDRSVGITAGLMLCRRRDRLDAR